MEGSLFGGVIACGHTYFDRGSNSLSLDPSLLIADWRQCLLYCYVRYCLKCPLRFAILTKWFL